MALRREADEPELRVLRGRGRPRELYPELELATDKRNRLAAHLRRTMLDPINPIRLEPLPRLWYLPAKDEWHGDRLTVEWLAEYRQKFPLDWQRMRRATVGYTTWTLQTAAKRARQERKAARDFYGQILVRAGIKSKSSLMEGGAVVALNTPAAVERAGYWEGFAPATPPSFSSSIRLSDLRHSLSATNF